MIKPAEITPSRTAQWLEFSCENCQDAGMINSAETIEIDMEGLPTEPLSYNCRQCGSML